MATMTFQEYLTANPTTTYPEQIPSALQTTIKDWFQYRNVVDDDKFGVYFQRVLNRDYARYNQLLRIEPGIAEYDWMVEEYLELERTIAGEGTSSNTGNSTGTHTGTVNVTGSGTTGNTRTDDTQSKTDGTNSNTETRDIAGTDSGTEALQHGHTVTTSGNDIQSGSVTRTHKQDANNNYDEDSGTDTTTHTRNYSDSSTETPGVTETTSTLAKQGTRQNTKELAKAAPMSISYASGTGTATGSSIPASLDWEYPSSQGENITTTEPTGTDPDTVQISRTGNNTTSNSQTGSGTDQTDYGKQHSISRDETDQETYNNVTNAKDSTETNAGTDTTTHNNNTTDTGTVKNEGANSQTVTNTGTVTDTGTSSNQQETTNNLTDSTETTAEGKTTDNRTEHEQHTGRHGEPAEIMGRAVAFIERTSAWAWLANRLEPCFMGVYDV